MCWLTLRAEGGDCQAARPLVVASQDMAPRPQTSDWPWVSRGRGRRARACRFELINSKSSAAVPPAAEPCVAATARAAHCEPPG